MGIFEDEEYIEKKINVNGKKIVARYSPSSGKFSFGNENNIGYGLNTTKTGAGAFATIKALTEAFKEINPEKIVYSSHGNTRKNAMAKDRFYARALKRLGYIEKSSDSDFHRGILSGEWDGPSRVWIRPNNSLEKHLSATTALVGILGSLFFIGANLTGNAIGNLSITNSGWIGGALFLIGVVGCLFWVKKRKFN